MLVMLVMLVMLAMLASGAPPLSQRSKSPSMLVAAVSV
jgi:hypothetical protein